MANYSNKKHSGEKDQLPLSRLEKLGFSKYYISCIYAKNLPTQKTILTSSMVHYIMIRTYEADKNTRVYSVQPLKFANGIFDTV